MTNFSPIIPNYNNQSRKSNTAREQPTKCHWSPLSQLQNLVEEETDIWRNPSAYRSINTDNNAPNSDNRFFNYLA